ncbi:prolyl oligopeptidase family serine peptidase [Rhizobium sp. 1399]|uniref:alpha/beta hydrolase family protein n=1 Tax=Rhizobium sp. 1399 TaxID=2817758 RepID=UPI002862D284|nr:prolyl oligopeptidase family serine peptidase [Rhizobium sp. 1399]MDR6671389.1 pimeloyl-ACP methyl ester carboxylesterase [Rhizobium sp. 1399]
MLNRRNLILGALPFLATVSVVAPPAPFFYPGALLADDWVPSKIGDERYLIRALGRPDKIIVYLHSWEGNHNQVALYKSLLGARDAVLVSPNFGGRNDKPSAMGSLESTDRIMRVISEARRWTGLTRVQVVGFSGGGMAALLLLGRRRKEVEKASLWVPIFDLASVFDMTSNQELRTDMLRVLGGPPEGPDDPRYLNRSPRSCMHNFDGFTKVIVNVGGLDTEVPKKNGEDACSAMIACAPDAYVSLVEWPQMGHGFDAAEAIRQLESA